ncbi:CotH kinase family protein [Myxococcus sp. Y35]|uniref:CotH kinase family protein n=1 Tax=Pseudomyxococcus flavus TaxID=3115648 RepID=UPI003CEA8B57
MPVGGKRVSRWFLAGFAGLVVACGGASSDAEAPGPASESPDTGNRPDAGLPPPGGDDGGTPDAGPPDGTPDGGAPDGGPPPEQPTVCAPTAGEARWVLEGEPVSATVTCGTGHAAAGLRFAVDNLPPGAHFDETTGTLSWTPGKDQAAVWHLTLREQTTGETGTLKVGVAENESAPGNVPIVDPAAYTEEFGLPVFHLSYEGKLTAGGHRPVQLVYRGKRFNLEAKYRGATSSVFPKRSLTLKFPDEDLFSEPVFGNGFKDRKRVVLITTFNDNSYLRSRLAFDVWSRMSPAHIHIRTYSAVLYANNEYVGLFTVADHVNKRLVAAHGLDKDSDVFKAEDHRANFSRLRKDGTPKGNLYEGFEKSEGTPEEGEPGAFATLEEITAFVADSDADTFRTGFAQRMNTQDYQDWWIFNTLILGTDSQAKNAYHAYDPTTGGPWRYIPWDLDASFGQMYDTRRTSPTARPTFREDNLIFQRLLDDPALAGPMRERYRALLRDALKVDVVMALIDRYVQETAPSARRDWAKWGEKHRNFGDPNDPWGGSGNFPHWHTRQDFNSYEEEVEYVRQWVRTRWDALEERLP